MRIPKGQGDGEAAELCCTGLQKHLGFPAGWRWLQMFVCGGHLSSSVHTIPVYTYACMLSGSNIL